MHDLCSSKSYLLAGDGLVKFPELEGREGLEQTRAVQGTGGVGAHLWMITQIPGQVYGTRERTSSTWGPGLGGYVCSAHLDDLGRELAGDLGGGLGDHLVDVHEVLDVLELAVHLHHAHLPCTCTWRRRNTRVRQRKRETTASERRTATHLTVVVLLLVRGKGHAAGGGGLDRAGLHLDGGLLVEHVGGGQAGLADALDQLHFQVLAWQHV